MSLLAHDQPGSLLRHSPHLRRKLRRHQGPRGRGWSSSRIAFAGFAWPLHCLRRGASRFASRACLPWGRFSGLRFLSPLRGKYLAPLYFETIARQTSPSPCRSPPSRRSSPRDGWLVWAAPSSSARRASFSSHGVSSRREPKSGGTPRAASFRASDRGQTLIFVSPLVVSAPLRQARNPASSPLIYFGLLRPPLLLILSTAPRARMPRRERAGPRRPRRDGLRNNTSPVFLVSLPPRRLHHRH